MKEKILVFFYVDVRKMYISKYCLRRYSNLQKQLYPFKKTSYLLNTTPEEQDILTYNGRFGAEYITGRMPYYEDIIEHEINQ